MDEYIRITIVKTVVTKCSQKTSRSAGTLCIHFDRDFTLTKFRRGLIFAKITLDVSRDGKKLHEKLKNYTGFR